MKQRRSEASRGQYVAAYAGSLLVAVCGLLAFRLAAEGMGETGFSEYSMSRRLLTLLTPALRLGVVVAIPRIVAASACETAPVNLVGGLLISVAMAGAWGGAVCIFPEQLATTLLGDPRETPLLYASMPMLLGLMVEGCCSAYCRGRLWIRTSCMITAIVIGVAPLSAFPFARSAVEYLTIAGSIVTILACGVAIRLLLFDSTGVRMHEAKDGAIRLVRFGLPRVPGDLAFYGLISIPPILVARQQGIEVAGYFAYALSVLTLLQQLVSPLGSALLPTSARLFAEGRTERIRGRLAKALGLSIVSTTAAVVLLEIFAEEAVSWHLGIESPGLVSMVRWVTVGAIPLNVFICLRGVADGLLRSPVAPLSCMAGLAVLAIAASINGAAPTGVEPVVVGFLVAITLPALITGAVLFTTLQTASNSEAPKMAREPSEPREAA